MRIVYCITALGTGGAENLLTDLCYSFKDKHEITVVFFRDYRIYEQQIRDMGIETIYIPCTFKNLPSVILKVRGIIKKKRAQVVHTHLPLADFIGRTAALTVRKVKIISSMHNSDPWKLRHTPPVLLLKLFNCLTVNLIPRIRLIAVSGSVKDFCKKHEWLRDKKIKVIYNFIEFENEAKIDGSFQPPFEKGDGFVLVTVARLEENKGHTFLFDAVAQVSQDERFRDIRLLVMGVGSQEEAFKAYVEERGMSEHIIFTGRKPNVYDYLRFSDLFVLASGNEGQSIAILEAFYCRLPVLASDISANIEILKEGENGILFRYGDVDDLAQKIKSFAAYKYNTALFTRNGYEFCDNLTRDRYTLLIDEFMRAK